MSERADVTPEAVRQFASQLKAFNEKMDADLKRLQSQFKNLGSTWKDQEHERFGQEFEQTLKVVTRFRQSSERHIPFLLRKAQKVEDYIKQR